MAASGNESVVRPRRRRGVLAALLLALAILTAGCGGTGAGSAPPTPGPPAASRQVQDSRGSPQPSPHGQPSLVPAAVVEIVDGDTVVVCLGDGRTERVRFIGVDTPESTREVEPYGKEAAAYTKKRLDGRTIHLELNVGERDKYGRLLAYVWLSPPQSASESEVRAKMFNAELLLAGMAQVMTVPPNVKYADLFVKLQREAREAGRGLWAAGAASSSGAGAAAAPARYVGNANSKKFHRPDCEWAAKIAPKNRVEFATREAAVAAGYAPCKVCRP